MYFEEPAAQPRRDGGPRARVTLLACAIGALALGAAPLLLKGLAAGAWR
jgi:hypothetical protein